MKLALFLLASAATLTIWIRNPFASWGYECGACALAAVCELRAAAPWSRSQFALFAIALWGFAQLALGGTVYRFATMEASLRLTALAATAFAASRILGHRQTRIAFLRAFNWLAFCLSVTAIFEYYTSSGRVFWIFPSGYPDAWGPFLSRNNFAEFLELALPVALWLALKEKRMPYVIIPAMLLAAGLACASRAGAALLVIESIVVCAVLRRWPSWPLAAATMLLAGLAAAGELGGRILQSAPFQYRREMAQSALVMIAERPWSGFGLGTFETVYPAYARFDNGAVVEHAHDDWLEWASEGGLPFSAVWVFLALSALRPAVRSVWGLGVPAIFLHALVDYPFARFGVTAWVFALIGALAGEESATNPTKPV